MTDRLAWHFFLLQLLLIVSLLCGLVLRLVALFT